MLWVTSYIYFHADIRCDDLLIPSNGNITSCSSGKIGVGYEGDTCNFSCNIGYKLKDDSIFQSTCQSNGSWNGPLTICKIKKCSRSSLPKNSKLSPSCGNKYNSLCSLQCQEGFTGIGNSSYMCNISENESSPSWLMVGDQAWNCSKGKWWCWLYNYTIHSKQYGYLLIL